MPISGAIRLAALLLAALWASSSCRGARVASAPPHVRGADGTALLVVAAIDSPADGDRVNGLVVPVSGSVEARTDGGKAVPLPKEVRVRVDGLLARLRAGPGGSLRFDLNRGFARPAVQSIRVDVMVGAPRGEELIQSLHVSARTLGGESLRDHLAGWSAKLDADEEELQWMAIVEIINMGDLRAVPLMTKYMADGEKPNALRALALYGVSDMGAVAAIPTLIDLLERGEKVWSNKARVCLSKYAAVLSPENTPEGASWTAGDWRYWYEVKEWRLRDVLGQEMESEKRQESSK